MGCLNGFENPPYALYKDHVLLQPTWVDYFGGTRGYCAGFGCGI